MERETLYATVADGVGTITMNQPDKQNAISGQAVEDLQWAFDLMQEEGARAVVLAAAGAVWCGGADLRQFVAARESLGEREPGVETNGWAEMMAALSGLILRVRRFPYPVIAAVGGSAVGGGANLALACDVRLASSDARFASSFIKVGLSSAAMGGTYLWPRTIGLSRAFEALLTGRFIEADEAERLGIVSRIVPAADLVTEAAALGATIARLPPLGVRATKRGLNVGADAPLEQALEFESALQAPLFLTDDHYEGVRAFVDKRPPEFRGR